MEDPQPSARFDSIADFYGKQISEESDPLQHALHTWDHAEYHSLQERDPELYRLICNQIGREMDILLGAGSVKLGVSGGHIELTWNGDDEDLFDLVLEGSALLCGDQP